MILLFLDTQTTGLDAKNSSIWQLSGSIKDCNREELFDYYIKPYKNESDSHLEEVSKITHKDKSIFDSFEDQKMIFDKFLTLLNTFSDGTKWENKITIIGWNTSFDMEFLREWFNANNNGSFSYRFWTPDIDVMRLAAFAYVGRRFTFKNFQLPTVYENLFNEVFENTYDALANIEATKRIFYRISSKLISG